MAQKNQDLCSCSKHLTCRFTDDSLARTDGLAGHVPPTGEAAGTEITRHYEQLLSAQVSSQLESLSGRIRSGTAGIFAKSSASSQMDPGLLRLGVQSTPDPEELIHSLTNRDLPYPGTLFQTLSWTIGQHERQCAVKTWAELLSQLEDLWLGRISALEVARLDVAETIRLDVPGTRPGEQDRQGRALRPTAYGAARRVGEAPAGAFGAVGQQAHPKPKL